MQTLIEAGLSPFTLSEALELTSTVLSIAGAELLSRDNTKSNWGWAFWLVSNVTFSGFAILNHHWGILVMQVWFTKTSVAGIRNHLFPYLRAGKRR